jgi:hypothetical protein
MNAANRNADCDTWDFLGRQEFERWSAEESQSEEQRQSVLRFLTNLEQDPRTVPATAMDAPFEGRFFEILKEANVVVTWMTVPKICVVTLLRIENIPS